MLFVVTDDENDQVWGPFTSEDQAEKAMLELAIENEWPEVQDAATHTGWLSDDSLRNVGLRDLQTPSIKHVEQFMAYDDDRIKAYGPFGSVEEAKKYAASVAFGIAITEVTQHDQDELADNGFTFPPIEYIHE
jgi:hypothetical protein